MSEYTHTLTVVVPKSLMNAANNLALLVGITADDINTFIIDDWIDFEDNTYSVCSTLIKPIVLGLNGAILTQEMVREHAIGVDLELAQYALDNSIIYTGVETITPDNIIIGVDFDPNIMFSDIGIIHISQKRETLEDIPPKYEDPNIIY